MGKLLPHPRDGGHTRDGIGGGGKWTSSLSHMDSQGLFLKEVEPR